MAFDLSRLRRGEWIAAIAAIVLFIVMFFGWYGPHEGADVSFSAWDAFSLIDLILLVTIVAALGLAVLTATQQTVALPVTAAVIVAALAFVSTVLVAFRVLIDQPGLGIFHVPDSAIDNTIWAWVGLLSCAAILYGGYLAMREEGTSLSDVKAQAAAAGQQARSAFESTAPRQDGESAAPPPPPPAPSEPPAAAPASEPPAAAPPPPPAAPAPSEASVESPTTSEPPSGQ